MRYSTASTSLTPATTPLVDDRGNYNAVVHQDYASGGVTAALPGSLANGTYNYYFDTEETQSDFPVAAGERWSGTFTVSGGVVTSFGAPSATTERLQAVRAQTVDRWGNTLTVVDPRNAAYVTRYRYNDQNQVEQTTQPNVEVWNEDTTHGSAAPVSTAYYDNLGRVIATTDANNHTARRIYDTAGNLVEERRADASRWTYAYDTLGRQVQEGDGVGLATTKTYDKLDRLIKTQQNGYTVSTQQFATFTYDELGNRTSVGNALGETTRYVYDSRGRLIQQLTPLWSTVDAAHSNLKTTYAYDDFGRKISETNGLNASQTWTYDYFGRAIGHTDVAGSASTYRYDAYGRLSQQTNSAVSQTLSNAGSSTTVSTDQEKDDHEKTIATEWFIHGSGICQNITIDEFTYAECPKKADSQQPRL